MLGGYNGLASIHWELRDRILGILGDHKRLASIDWEVQDRVLEMLGIEKRHASILVSSLIDGTCQYETWPNNKCEHMGTD